MAVKLVSDLHGRFTDLPAALEGGDVLIVLGDILDFIDWADWSGILPDVVGRERLMDRLSWAIREGPQAAVQLREAILSPQGEYYREIRARAREQYARFADALRRAGCRAYVIYGNGDLPDLLEEALDGLERAVLARGREDIDGMRFGFVPGAVHSPFRMPSEMDEEEYGRCLEDLGGVDVLCTHIPPRVQEAVFDVVAGRPVEGSLSLLRYLEERRPSYLYHGHVHQPARKELLIGGTRVINVGYYKREGSVHRHR